MNKIIIIEESIKYFIDDLINKNSFQIGLLFGQVFTKKIN